MTILPKNLLQYQHKRAVSGPWQLQGALNGKFDACIVIPALGESAGLPQTLNSLSLNAPELLSRTLLVIVVNQRSDADPALRNDNLETLAWLRNHPDDRLNLSWVDACSFGSELPLRQGVGLARKIGFDLALTQLNWQGRPLLVSLDADTLVNRHYLGALFTHFRSARQGAAVIPFRHQAAESCAQEQAIRRYELYLRSYVYGLSLAGSPYAYASIGSAFACTAEAYIQAGGMNRRLAGEDFYFLQQLAKTCGISELNGGLVSPSPRISARTPFGTGMAVRSQSVDGISSFSFCDKSAFTLLKNWLSLVCKHWHASADHVLLRAKELDQQLASFLINLNFTAVWRQLQANCSVQDQFIRSFHCWFDGLRTRQLLTTLSSLQPTSELELINELFRWGGLEDRESAVEQLTTLEQLQGVAHSRCVTAT